MVYLSLIVLSSSTVILGRARSSTSPSLASTTFVGYQLEIGHCHDTPHWEDAAFKNIVYIARIEIEWSVGSIVGAVYHGYDASGERCAAVGLLLEHTRIERYFRRIDARSFAQTVGEPDSFVGLSLLTR